MPEITERRRNWAAWGGLLLALAAVLSNFAFFMAVPGQKVIPFLGWALAVVALVFALTGVMRAFRQPQVYGGKVSSSILGVISMVIVALVVFGAIQSRKLPAADAAPQVGQKAPDFALADTNGNKVSLGQLLGSGGGAPPVNAMSAVAANAGASATAAAPKAVLLIFYRGYW
jgi:hypothetical protein